MKAISNDYGEDPGGLRADANAARPADLLGVTSTVGTTRLGGVRNPVVDRLADGTATAAGRIAGASCTAAAADN